MNCPILYSATILLLLSGVVDAEVAAKKRIAQPILSGDCLKSRQFLEKKDDKWSARRYSPAGKIVPFVGNTKKDLTQGCCEGRDDQEQPIIDSSSGSNVSANGTNCSFNSGTKNDIQSRRPDLRIKNSYDGSGCTYMTPTTDKISETTLRNQLATLKNVA